MTAHRCGQGSLPVLASWDRDARNETETVGWRCLLNSTSPLRREAVLVAEMQSVLTALAGVPDEKDITPNSRLFDLGLDSVAGIEFVSKLETELNLTLDPIVIYEFPTLGALAPWLLDQVYPPAAETGIPPTKLSEASSEVANEMAALAALLKA